MSARPRARQRAMTLLEMLVVLVLVSLVATLVMSALGQVTGLLARVGGDRDREHHSLMGLDWLRQTVAAAVPNGEDRDDFAGDRGAFGLLTYRPLLGAEGVPTAVRFSVQRDGSLLYEEGGQRFEMPLPRGALAFHFQDVAGGWHDSWPVDERRLLPLRVRLDAAAGASAEFGPLTQLLPLTRREER